MVSPQARVAVAADIEWLTATYLTALHSAITAERGFWDEQRERQQFLQQLRLTDTRVILLANSAVGFYTAWMEADHLFLGTLCVAPEHQNLGIGSSIMRRLIAQQARGLPVRLAVLKANHAARRFYERLGCDWRFATPHHDHFEWRASRS